jgi:hypothetical protein
MSSAVERDGDLALHLLHALEDEAAQPLAEVQEKAPPDCHYFSELESSLSEWSFAYGIAWALIRMRDPFLSSSRVAELAREATSAAWRAMGDESWTAMIAADRARRGPAEGDEEPSQLGEFMQKVARARPRRRPPRGDARGEAGS